MISLENRLNEAFWPGSLRSDVPHLGEHLFQLQRQQNLILDDQYPLGRTAPPSGYLPYLVGAASGTGEPREKLTIRKP
jgi:hypothetical protein